MNKHTLLNRLALVAVAGLLAISAQSAQAQLGGLGKSIPGAGGGGGAAGIDLGAKETELFTKFSPASKLLAEAADYYSQALKLKVKDERKKAEGKSEQTQALANYTHAKTVFEQVLKESKKSNAASLSPEAKELLKKGHEKLLEGGAAFVQMAVPTALAIKEITDKDPKALVGHMNLVKLAAICAKDGVTLVGYLGASNKIAKTNNVPVKEAGEFK